MAVGTIVNGDASMYFTQIKGDVQKADSIEALAELIDEIGRAHV